MTSPLSNKNKDLLDRLVVLEKFIELKSNECAYYRTKVHLMQMSSNRENIKRSSSEDISIDIRKDMSKSSIRSKRRYRTSAQNQNHYEENRLEQMFISYLNKHRPQFQDKNIQCNENDFHLIESSHTTLKIRLPRRFVKSLRAHSSPKLKVHLSSALLNKLFQSIHSNQNQFGKIAACINQENPSKAIHVKAEIKAHRLPIIRHTAHSNRRKSSHTQRKKRHIYKSSSTSQRSSLTNITQTNRTFSSSSRLSLREIK